MDVGKMHFFTEDAPLDGYGVRICRCNEGICSGTYVKVVEHSWPLLPGAFRVVE